MVWMIGNRRHFGDEDRQWSKCLTAKAYEPVTFLFVIRDEQKRAI